MSRRSGAVAANLTPANYPLKAVNVATLPQIRPQTPDLQSADLLNHRASSAVPRSRGGAGLLDSRHGEQLNGRVGSFSASMGAACSCNPMSRPCSGCTASSAPSSMPSRQQSAQQGRRRATSAQDVATCNGCCTGSTEAWSTLPPAASPVQRANSGPTPEFLRHGASNETADSPRPKPGHAHGWEESASKSRPVDEVSGGLGASGDVPHHVSEVLDLAEDSVTSIDHACEDDAEAIRLREELHQLQQTLRHTQVALVGKYRGSGYRFVGGGQFRTSEQKGKPLKEEAPKGCSTCHTNKNLLKKARQDEAATRETIHKLKDRISQLEHTFGQQQQSNLGREEQVAANAEMAAALRSLSHSLGASHSELVSEQLNIEAERAKFAQFREDSASQIKKLEHELKDARGKLLKLEAHLDAARREIAELNAQGDALASLRSELASAQSSAATARSAMKTAQVDLEAERAASSAKHAKLSTQLKQLRAALEEAQATAKAKADAAGAEEDARRARQQLEEAKREAERNRQRLSDLEDQLRIAIEALKQTHRYMLAHQTSMSASLKESEAEHAAAQELIRSTFASQQDGREQLQQARRRAEASQSSLVTSISDLEVEAAEARSLTLSRMQVLEQRAQQQRASLHADAAAFSERVRTLESQLAQAKAQAAADADRAAAEARARASEHNDAMQKLQARQCELEARAAMTKSQMQKYSDETRRLSDELRHAADELKAAQEERNKLDETARRLAAAEAALEALRARYAQDTQRASDDSAALRKELEQALRSRDSAVESAASASASASRLADTQAAEALRQERERHAMEMDELRAKVCAAEQSAAEEASRAASAEQKQAIAVEANALAEIEAGRVHVALRKAQAEIAMNKEAQARRASDAEALRREAELLREAAEQKKQQAESAEACLLRSTQKLKEANETIKELQEKERSNTSLSKKLEDSLQSLVRLCVVAPTVNVSFGAQNDACKAPLPRHKIKAVLEKQILPRFTDSFMQLEESVSPDGKPMDLWLQDVTTEMQASIERHLANVFN